MALGEMVVNLGDCLIAILSRSAGEEQRARQPVSVIDRRRRIQGENLLHRGIGWSVVSGITGERIPGPVVGARLRQIHWVSVITENATFEGCCGYDRGICK